MDQNSPTNNNPVSGSASDSMPPIPIFDPAPVPNPVVTDSMPPIPVSALEPAPAAPPVTSSMPAMATPVAAPKPTVPAVSNIPMVTNPAANAAQTMNMRPTAQAQTISLRPAAQPVQPVQPVQPRPNPVAPNQPTAPRPVAPSPFNAPTQVAAAPNPAVNPAVAPNPMVAPNQATAPNQNPILTALGGAPAQPEPTDPFAPRSAFDNPFAEAAAKNESVRNVSFSDPNLVKQANKPNKMRTIILAAIVGLIVLVLVVIMLMPKGSSNSGGTSNQPEPTPEPTPENSASAYVCEYVYGASDLSEFGSEASSGKKVVNINFMDGALLRLETIETVEYNNADVIRTNLVAAKRQFVDTFTEAGFESDPTISSYSSDETKIEITHTTTDFSPEVTRLLNVGTLGTLSQDGVLDVLEDNKFSCRVAE